MKRIFELQKKWIKGILLCTPILCICNISTAQFTGAAYPAINFSGGPIYINSYPYNSEPPVYIGKGLNPGSFNTALGVAALSSTTNTGTGAYGNTAIGFNALKTGSYIKGNTAVGAFALDHANNTAGGVDGNTAVGNNAMTNFSLGANNTACGNGALAGYRTGSDPYVYHSTGSSNSAFGNGSLGILQSGNSNVAVGNSALYAVTTGSYNVGVGHSANSSANGNNNVALGVNALIGFTSGSHNVAIGQNASVPNGDGQLSIQNIIYGAGNTAQGANISNGFIGIGVKPAVIGAGSVYSSTARAKLHVNGTLRLDKTVTGFSQTAPVSKYLFVDAQGMVAEAPAINLYTADGTITNPATTTSSNRTVNMNGQNIWFRSTVGEANGKIYIGDNDAIDYPDNMFSGNYRLYVQDGILTERIKVAIRNDINWADYVFADNYSLMPIKELASFVKINKHLPGISSAENLVKEGLDLGRMQAKQITKIEELTLYIIDQNNKLEKQNAEIETLKEQVKILLEKSK